MGIPRFGHFCSIDNCIRYFLLHLFCLYFMLFLSFIFLLCWLESKRLPHPSEVSLNLVLLIFNSLTLSSFVFLFFFDHLFLCNKGIKKYFLLLFRHSNFTFLSPYFILLQQTLKCSLSPTLFFFLKIHSYFSFVGFYASSNLFLLWFSCTILKIGLTTLTNWFAEILLIIVLSYAINTLTCSYLLSLVWRKAINIEHSINMKIITVEIEAVFNLNDPLLKILENF